MQSNEALPAQGPADSADLPLPTRNPAAAPQGPGGTSQKFPRALIAVLVLAAIVYIPTLFGYFLVDDFWHLANAAHTGIADVFRPWVYSGDDVASYWFAHRRVHALTEETFFRPAVTLLYMMVLKTVGVSATLLHAISVSLHVATAAAVLWLARRLFLQERPDKPRAALTAALIAGAAYGLHPAHYEAVTWIAANADLLLGFFGTVCVAAFVDAECRREAATVWRTTLLRAASVAAFVAALLSKEMAVTLPFVLIGWQIVNRLPGEGWLALARRRWRVHAPFWLILVPYVLWRLPATVGIFNLHSTGNYVVTTESFTTLGQLLANLVYSVGSLFLLYPIVPVDLSGVLGGGLWLVGIGGTLLIAVLIIVLARASGVYRRVLWFGALWLIVTLAPFMFVQPAQRLIHFPAVGFALMAAAVAAGQLARLRARNRRTTTVRWVVVSVCAVWFSVAAISSWAMTYITLGVKEVVDALVVKLDHVPAGSRVYLIDAWQMAWMMELYFPIRYPLGAPDVQVLTFDPTVLPPKPGPIPDVLVGWFEVLYGPEAGASRSQATWLSPATLELYRPERPFFSGIIEQQMPVATEASTLGVAVDTGAFVARATGAGQGGVDRIAFNWRRGAWNRPPVFLQWQGSHWQSLRVPDDVLAFGTARLPKKAGDEAAGDQPAAAAAGRAASSVVMARRLPGADGAAPGSPLSAGGGRE